MQSQPSPQIRARKAVDNVHEWTAQDVARFMASLGFEEHRDRFLASGISGSDFVKLNSVQLRDQFGIQNIGDRKKILKSITKLV